MFVFFGAILMGCTETQAPVQRDLPAASNGSTGGGSVNFGPPPKISVVAQPIAEGDIGETTLLVTFNLSIPSGGAIYVDFATENRTAIAGEDYRKSKGKLTILPGEISKSLAIPIIGDQDQESDESFILNTFVKYGASVLSPVKVLTILDDDAPQPGLPSRPINTSCVAPDKPVLDSSISIQRDFLGLAPLIKPVGLLQAPGDPSHWYAVEQDGRVLRFENSPGVTTVEPFIDIRGPGGLVDVDSSEGETGLLGMAFHPDYETNRTVFLSYTVDGNVSGRPHKSVIAKFQSNDGGLSLDAATESRLITIDQPDWRHNGGHISFGPDGYLYAAFGDGGPGGDPNDRAQDTSSLFGAMIRIDVDSGSPYSVPSDNIFSPNPLCTAGEMPGSCPEIYAWGFRNPWRWNFDGDTNQLYLADVGQGQFEELDIVENGGNYGWRCREGMHDFDTSGTCPAGLIDPVAEYENIGGASVTGGFVYRGSSIPQLIGRYIFGDFVDGRIMELVPDGLGGYTIDTLADTNFNISTFAQDENGELLFLDYFSGSVYRIIANTNSSSNTIPEFLSLSGCVDPANPVVADQGMIPYDINVSFWSDGAEKLRHFAIPDGSTVDVNAAGDWIFPTGTVLMKSFSLGEELVETRLFMRHTNGDWAGYTYEWNQTATEATRVVGGKTKEVQGQQWIYPSESQCMNCHTTAAGFSLGIENSQLNRDYLYPSTGILANQLFTADAIAILSDPLPTNPGNMPALAAASDSQATLDDKARSYLHVNCSGCHRPTAPTPSNMDLRFETPLSATNTCDVAPASGDLGIPGALLLSPGDANMSILVQRMSRRDAHGMPPLGSNEADIDGVILLSQWINSMSACPAADWQGVDIGSVAATGSFSNNSGTFVISGSGSDIWDTSDEFYFVYKTLDGDGEIKVRVESLTDTDAWARTGAMMRESLSASSKHAMMIVTPQRGAGLQYRTSTGGITAPSTGGGSINGTTAPVWLRLVRQGDLFTGYESSDGIVWLQAGQVTVSMPASILVGIPVTSHNDGVLTTAVLDNVVIQ